MFETLESRQMFSVTVDTHSSFDIRVPPSQSVGESKNIGVQGAAFQQSLSSAADSPGISGLNSASTVMVAASAK